MEPVNGLGFINYHPCLDLLLRFQKIIKLNILILSIGNFCDLLFEVITCEVMGNKKLPLTQGRKIKV